MVKHFNVIIAGGGMVGMAMACALGRNAKLAAKKILLLEGGPRKQLLAKKTSDPYSNRVVSLNPGTKKFFEDIGVWKNVTRFAPVKKLQVWDSYSDAMITFEHPRLEEEVSYIVENDLILHALGNELDGHEKVQINYDSKVKNIKLPISSGKATVELNEGPPYTCDLLIGAEGFNSGTRHAIGSQWLSWQYKQSGVVATLQLSEPTDNVVAWQRFLDNGPIALLPLTSELSSLVWTTSPQDAAELIKMSDEAFVDAVNDALWKKQASPPLVQSASQGVDRVLEALSLSCASSAQQLPPSVSGVSPNSRASFPLGFGHAATYVAPSAALVGDAAHRVHPLAGQGVNLGFGDVETLTNILAEAVYSGEKLGTLSHLKEYERRRQLHNVPTMFGIDALQKLYSTTATPVVLLRSLGMQITHALSPVKKAIMNHASS